MKLNIVKALNDGYNVIFYFDKNDSFNADRLVDIMENDTDSISVSHKSTKSTIIINLNLVRKVDIYKS